MPGGPFTGYSGSDYFDVDLVLKHFSELALAGKLVVWVTHDTARERLIPPGSTTPVPRQIQWLQAAGASCWVVQGDTSRILDTVGRQLGIFRSPVGGGETEIDPWWTAAGPQRQQRIEAKAQLYAWFGLSNEVLSLGPALPRTRTTYAVMAQAVWNKGKYQTARRHWMGAYPGSSPQDVFARRERMIAIAQIRGQLIRAWVDIELLALIRGLFWQRIPVPTWSLDEHRGKVLVDMSRIPGLRVLVTKRRVIRARGLVEAALENGTGIHAATRLQATLRSLSTLGPQGSYNAERSPTVDAFEERFLEAEALSAAINYRHRAMRAELSTMTRAERAGCESVVNQLRNHFREQFLVGLEGDLLRTVFLPGAHLAFTRAEVANLLRDADICRMQRLRLAVHDRLKRRLGLGVTITDVVAGGMGSVVHR